MISRIFNHGNARFKLWYVKNTNKINKQTDKIKQKEGIVQFSWVKWISIMFWDKSNLQVMEV